MLSRIICDVGENVLTIQPRAMLQHTYEDNHRRNCSEIPELDLTPFQEIDGAFKSEWQWNQSTAINDGQQIERFQLSSIKVCL